MKQSEGFSRFWPTTAMGTTMLLSFGLLAWAVVAPGNSIHRVWTGIGAVGTFIVGIAILGETVSLARILAA